MPKMDGFHLYSKLREQDSKVKICFLTASELFYEEFRNMRLKQGNRNWRRILYSKANQN